MHNKYDLKLKENTRSLRSNMTEQEILLWQHLRRRQVHGVKFLRQKPILGYILDFYSHQIKLAIELDGSQHYYDGYIEQDKTRDINLNHNGIHVLRYSNRDIDLNFKTVMEDIYTQVSKRL
jgi:very-short-patch-repair endonuclease